MESLQRSMARELHALRAHRTGVVSIFIGVFTALVAFSLLAVSIVPGVLDQFVSKSNDPQRPARRAR